jgi:hypothetical protein
MYFSHTTEISPSIAWVEEQKEDSEKKEKEKLTFETLFMCNGKGL